jgi:hypothetical protein
MHEQDDVENMGAPKIKFFAWLAIQNNLWTVDRLEKRGSINFH